MANISNFDFLFVHTFISTFQPRQFLWTIIQRIKMTLDEFRQSLTAAKPSAGLSLALVGLWWDARGDWKRAHESAQQDEGPEGSWVHA
jgi:hypothetical protein